MLNDLKSSILVVDDDLRLREPLARDLIEQGYVVYTVGDGDAMRQLLARECFELMMLDQILPGKDGLAICRWLPAEGSLLPVIILTPTNAAIDRTVGSELGADDYLATPFNLRELAARINAVLRCRAATANWIYAMRRLNHSGQPTLLTTDEFDLLRVVVQYSGQSRSRDRLIAPMWGWAVVADDRSTGVAATPADRGVTSAATMRIDHVGL